MWFFRWLFSPITTRLQQLALSFRQARWEAQMQVVFGHVKGGGNCTYHLSGPRKSLDFGNGYVQVHLPMGRQTWEDAERELAASQVALAEFIQNEEHKDKMRRLYSLANLADGSLQPKKISA